jgi:hypothetical protein
MRTEQCTVCLVSALTVHCSECSAPSSTKAYQRTLVIAQYTLGALGCFVRGVVLGDEQ